MHCRHTKSTSSGHGLRRWHHHHIYTHARVQPRNAYKHTYIKFCLDKTTQSHTNPRQNNFDMQTTSIQNCRSTSWRPFTNTIQHMHCRHTKSTSSGHGLRRWHHHHIYTHARVQPRNAYKHTYIKFCLDKTTQSHTNPRQNNLHYVQSIPCRI